MHGQLVPQIAMDPRKSSANKPDVDSGTIIERVEHRDRLDAYNALVRAYEEAYPAMGFKTARSRATEIWQRLKEKNGLGMFYCI